MVSFWSRVNEKGRIKGAGLKSFSVSLLVFLAGAAYCLYYGRIGYMPLDQSIVFDGAWRILSGQIPFRDFTAPNAFTPILIQAGFFKLFAVNWFVFCLHAALFNGLFCVLVFFLLRRFGGGLFLSFFYAILSAVVFYPPFGVPFQDQHAFFFTFLFIFLCCYGITATNLFTKQVMFFFIPIVFTVAFFSKQIPTAFGAILVFVILVVFERKNLFALFRALCAGSLAALLLLLIAYFTLGLDFEQFKLFYFKLPAQTGDDRIIKSLSNLPHLLNYMWSHGHKKIYFPFIIVTAVFITTIISFFRNRKNASISFRHRIMENFFLLVLAESLFAVSIAFFLLTNNQIENGAAYMFVAFGFCHLFLEKIRGKHVGSAHETRTKRPAVLFHIGIVLLYCSGVFCAVNFDRQVNATRIVQDMKRDDEAPVMEYKEVPSSLSFLHWDVGPYYKGTPKDFTDVINFFQSNEGNFFLIGDSSILYGITKRPSVNPVLWFHPGLTMPSDKSPLFASYQGRLIDNLNKFKVRYILLEAVTGGSGHEATWFKINLAYFPKLERLVKKRGTEKAHFGIFKIIELKQPFGEENKDFHEKE